MVRKTMSEVENERKKRQLRSFLHNGRRVEEIYPQVKKIEIIYLREHNSFLGHNEESSKWTISPQCEMYFLIECLNRECTSIGFNLQSVISSAIHARKTEVSGEMKCEGQEAPDHPEQSCSGKLKYNIKITFKQ